MEISILNLVLYTIVKANEVLDPLEANFSKERVHEVVMAVLTDEEKAEFETTNVDPCLRDATGRLTVPRGSTAYINDLIQRSIGDLYGHNRIDNNPQNKFFISIIPLLWGRVKMYLQCESATHGEYFERVDKYFETKYGGINESM